ncbi:Phosphopantetheine adenylyltransferase [Bienertia sinuspersici]
MPGNEVGDRVHNFFDQGSLSQDQRHTQVVAGNWPVYNNNLWSGNERQTGGPVNSGSENYNAQQSDLERGQGNQILLGPQGLNFTRPGSRPDFVKSPQQLQQLNLNGFMHASQVGHTRQNEANFLGMDTEPDRHNMTSRGLSFIESQQRSGSQQMNSAGFGGSDSPMNFSFLGGQQQLNGQQHGMLQSFSRQQPGNNDAQFQQQIMMKQMQELQRQQQLQQLEAMQRSATNHVSSFPNQSAGQHPPAINGNPVHDTSNYPWSSQVMAANANWQQRGASSSVQGYSNGFMVTPEQGQAMFSMGLIPQQTSQSLYGVPVPGSRNANAFSHSSIDKHGMVQGPGPGPGPGPNSSFPGNQYGSAEQVTLKDGTMGLRYKSEGKSSLEQVSSQRLGNVVNLGGFAPVQQRNVAMSEGGGQGFTGGSEFVTEKSVAQASPQGGSTQSAVALDPTEEKILFGSDDNIWEAFGGPSLSGSGEATDLLNGLPSMQSGTWSALMQSAVAETSSTDVGMQEEWSGLGSQNSQSQSGNQHPSVFHGNDKSQLNLVDSSGRASLGSRPSSNDVSTHNVNMNANHMNSSGQQQSSSKQRREYLQSESQSSQEGRRWLDNNQQKLHVEEKRVVENSNSSRDSSRTDTAFWSHQQNAFPHNNNAQQSSRPSPSNFTGYVPANGGLVSTNQDNLLDKDRNMQMSRETGRAAAMRLEPVPNSNVSIGSSLVSSKDEAGASGFSNMKGNYESSQKLPNNHHLDLWKSVNSSGKSGFEGSSRDQHNLNMGPPVLETSDNSLDGAAAVTHETENGDRREGSNDSNRSSFPNNASVGGLRENMWSDAAERRSLPGAKDKATSQGGKKGPSSRKFQYHPMGDLDMDSDSSYGAKKVQHSQPLSQHFSSGSKSQEANARFLGQLNTNSTDMEKGRVTNFRGPVNVPSGVSGGVHPGYLPSTSTPFVRSGEISSPNQHMSPRQNMLELLHKVDQSKEQPAASYPISTDYNRVSDIPAVGPAAPSQGQFSTSHGFSLQLAPPSQGIAPSNHNDAAQSSTKTIGSPNSGYAGSEKGDKTHAWLPPASSAQCLPPSRQPNQMEFENESDRLGNADPDISVPNLKGNFSASLPSSHLKNTLQNQHLIAPGGKSTSDQSATVSPNRHAYHDQHLSSSQPQATTSHSVNNSQDGLMSGRDMNQSGMRALVHQMPASFRAAMAGMTRKDNLPPMASNLWTSQQQLLGAQGCITPELIKSQFQSPDAPETSFTQTKKDEQDGAKRVVSSSSQGIAGVEESQTAEGRSTMKVAGESQEEEPSARHLSGASPSTSAVSQKDVEAVKPNFSTHNSYSLLHQMQAMKSMGTDPSHRESKRLKGQDNSVDSQHTVGQPAEPVGGNMDSAVRDPSIGQTSVSAGDAKMLSFSPQLGNRNPSFQLPHGIVTSQDMLSFGRSDPQRFAAGNITNRNEHTGISPQMAPTWFEQYGTFKNGQLPVHNVPRIPMMKNAQQQFINGKSPSSLSAHNSVQLATAVTEIGQIANTYQTANAYTPNEHVSSLQALVPHVPAPSLASMRPKKRKTATSDLLPWNKEIGESLKRLQNMSSAEVDWAQSSNRLTEKVEDEMDTSGDLLPMIRPKRRLLLTTQLIQQVFPPPSAAVLSLDASSNYEVIVYSLARAVFGEACSLVSGVESNSPVESGKIHSEKGKNSEKIRDQYFSKVVEDYVTRSKELEDDLLRLDKRASILDFRLDCQDLERFSVINRFARFHGRGQVEGAETSSSSDASAAVNKPCPQRYVSAYPMPRNVPERVQCLSL